MENNRSDTLWHFGNFFPEHWIDSVCGYDTRFSGVVLDSLPQMYPGNACVFGGAPRLGIDPFVEAEEALPNDFSMSQNYPNPFNPTTTVAFTIPEASYVTIEIFNILGQNVRVLVDRDMPAGTHEVVWNGKNDSGAKVSSGIYLYRLTAGDYSQSKKMVLLK